MLQRSPISPFIYIDVEAMERACQQEKEDYEAQCRKLKEEEETQVSICVTSKCPLLSKRKNGEEWCLSGDAHLNPFQVHNASQH